MSIRIKTPEEIEKMRVAGRLAAELLDYITPFVVAGTTTEELDRLCHAYMTDVQGTIPAPLNYAPPGHSPYPKSICTSINHQICHGIPGDRKLKNGDILKIDVTVIKDGFHGDTSRMFMIGQPSVLAKRLVDVTWQCLWLGIEQVRPGARLGDIGHVIQTYAEKQGFSIVREFCGHGIGRNFHEDPQVLHYGRPGTGPKLEPGMIFTIEPMLNAGRREIRQLADGWTVVTKDHSLSAQWEHMLCVTPTGYEVLTVSAGTPGCGRPVRILESALRKDSMPFCIFCSADFLISAGVGMGACVSGVSVGKAGQEPDQGLGREPGQTWTSVPSSSPHTTRVSAPVLKIEKTFRGSFWSRHSAKAAASITFRLRMMASSKVISR